MNIFPSEEELESSSGWMRVQEDLTGLDFLDLVTMVGVFDSIKVSMCLRCISLVPPIDGMKEAHLLWHDHERKLGEIVAKMADQLVEDKDDTVSEG